MASGLIYMATMTDVVRDGDRHVRSMIISWVDVQLRQLEAMRGLGITEILERKNTARVVDGVRIRRKRTAGRYSQKRDE